MLLVIKGGFMQGRCRTCGDGNNQIMETGARNRRKLNILILLPDRYDPGMPARPAVMGVYGDCLAKMGHDVTWIMCAQRGVEEVVEETFENVRIVAIPYDRGSFLLSRLFFKLLFLWKEKSLLSTMLRKGEGAGIIQARNSIIKGILAIYLKRKFKIPFVFQYSFPFSGAWFQRYRLGYGRIFYVMARLERVMSAFIMKRADLVLPISQWMLEDLAGKGIPRQKMMPLPLAVNPELFSPSVSGETVRTKYDLGNSSVLLYLGAMDKLRQLDILLYMMAQLKQAKRSTRLLLVGDGDDRSRLDNLTYELGLTDDVIFTGQVPYFEVPQFIAAADIALSPVPPLDLYKVSSPCKLFEYMAVAKPVVANHEIPEHKEVLEHSGGGILVPFASGAFASGVIELLDDTDRAAEMGRRGREWVLQNRTYDILARQVEERYMTLVRREAQ